MHALVKNGGNRHVAGIGDQDETFTKIRGLEDRRLA
jgi:hypothetical protein